MSISYRLTRLARSVLGCRTVLRLYLFWSWLLARLALELAQDHYGHDFRDRVMGVTDDTLRRYTTDAVVVDAGCGMGRLCQRVAPWAKVVVGIDQDADKLAVAKRTTTAPNVEYRLGDATRDLAQVSGVDHADVVLAVHVIEHIDDAVGFLRDLHDFARTVIVEVPDFAADPLNAVRWREGCRWYSDADHVAEYTVESLGRQVGTAGWSIVHLDRRGGTIAAVLCKPDVGSMRSRGCSTRRR